MHHARWPTLSANTCGPTVRNRRQNVPHMTATGVRGFRQEDTLQEDTLQEDTLQEGILPEGTLLEGTLLECALREGTLQEGPHECVNCSSE